LASATLKLPDAMQKIIRSMIDWAKRHREGETALDLNSLGLINQGAVDAERIITTTVDSKDVVSEELVKKAIFFEGATASMEECINDLHSTFRQIESKANEHGGPSKPKAIYVCKTN